MNFYHWLIQNKNLSKATALKYDLVIKNRINEWLPSYELPQNSIEFEALKQTIFTLDIYQDRNRVGNNMYSSALKHYGDFLKEIDVNDGSIFTEKQIFTTDAERLVKVRLIQNKFRKKLFDFYPYCAVTGFSHSRLLIASHIKPWAKCDGNEKVDVYNGFLLSPNFDRLFDQGFITFLDTGIVQISKKLNEIDKEFFSIPTHLKSHLDVKHLPYLHYHQNEIYMG